MSTLCDYGCGQEAKHKMSNGKLCCSENYQSCPSMRSKNSEGLKKAHENGRKEVKHLNGHRGWRKGKTVDIGEGRKKPISETEKKKNIKYKLVEKRGPQCESCNGRMHQGEKIPLEMHRIDESKGYKESGPENLKLLCPNCHAQTENYAGKKRSPVGTKKVTDGKVAEALESEPCIRQALMSVGLVGNGGNYERAKRVAEENGIAI